MDKKRRKGRKQPKRTHVLNTLPALPVLIETRAQIKERLPEAVQEVIPYADVITGKRHPPSKFRKHVFDFDDGIRMILDRHSFNNIERMHLSISFANRHQAFAAMNRYLASREVLCSVAGIRSVTALWVAKYLNDVLAVVAPYFQLRFEIFERGVFHFTLLKLTEEEARSQMQGESLAEEGS